MVYQYDRTLRGALCEEEREPVARGAQIRRPGYGALTSFQRQYSGQGASPKAVVQDRGAALRIGIDHVNPILNYREMTPVTEMRHDRHATLFPTRYGNTPDSAAVELG